MALCRNAIHRSDLLSINVTFIIRRMNSLDHLSYQQPSYANAQSHIPQSNPSALQTLTQPLIARNDLDQKHNGHSLSTHHSPINHSLVSQPILHLSSPQSASETEPISFHQLKKDLSLLNQIDQLQKNIYENHPIAKIKTYPQIFIFLQPIFENLLYQWKSIIFKICIPLFCAFELIALVELQFILFPTQLEEKCISTKCSQMSFSLGKTLSIGAISSTVFFTLGILSAIISRYHKPIVHTLLCLYLIFHITASILHTTMLFISYKDYQLLNENRKQCGLDEKLEDYLGPWNAFFSLYSLILASIQAVFNLFVFVGLPVIKKCEDSEVD